MEVKTALKSRTTREVIAFPDVNLFYDSLQDRLNYVLSRFKVIKDKYTVFINALPRKETTVIDRFENVVLNYAGTDMQRILLEGDQPKAENDEYWDALKQIDLFSESGVVSSELYHQFKNGEYGLDKIVGSVGTLYEYFKLDQPKDKRLKSYNKGQICEYNILKNNFDLLEYRYFSIPLIQFGEFDGVIHLVYSKADHQRILAGRNDLSGLKHTIATLIKSFSSVYEMVILDWDLVGTNAPKETAVRAALDAAIDPVFFKTFNTNPILKELEFRLFYQTHSAYYNRRFAQSDKISLHRRQQYRKIAIMSILIDSYAHNVTAHSLTALEWWFRLRAERIRREGQDNYHRFVEDYSYLPVVSKESLALEIYPLMKFLLDKGAFWTGLTREQSFGGKTSTFFSVLWHDFINNPLYLGTIAFSEGILKLNVNISILRTVSNENKALFKKEVVVDEEGVRLDGNFVSVDLSKLSSKQLENRPERMSDFVVPSSLFGAFEKVLKNLSCFFPGGVVGRHAFFTILENEIRNVKHYPAASIKKMQTEGLTINISIEEDTYRKGADIIPGKSEYFKVGVWINEPIKLHKGLVQKRIDRLGEDIIDEIYYKPKLGGTYQDKVCAAMLFNNTFTSVQEQKGPRNARYYPWIKVGGSYLKDNQNGYKYDYELSWNRMTKRAYNETREYFDDHFNEGQGFFKKFFYIWKGEDIYDLATEDPFSSKYENHSRFKFVCIPTNRIDRFCEARKSGVIRVIEHKVENTTDAYRIWLSNWLNKKAQNKIFRVKFTVNSQPAGQLTWDGKKVVFLNRRAIKNLSAEQRAIYTDSEKTNTKEIKLLHGSNDLDNTAAEGICRFRNHGIFKQYFLNNTSIDRAEIDESTAAELLEILATRISIFDNRIANRLKNTLSKPNLEHALDCRFYEEDIAIWEAAKTECINKCNILVVHLSFIESFRDENGFKKYSENNIVDFVKDEVIKNRDPDYLKNFFLVLTTGRGRTQWWRSIENEVGDSHNIACFTTFRPVESIIDSVENAINIEDDFELKYRLVKVLFGS